MAEFGLFGQLSQYHNDLAIIEHARERAPFAFRWVLHMHDLYGFEGEWRSDTDPPGAYAELTPDAKAELAEILKKTGCLSCLQVTVP